MNVYASQKVNKMHEDRAETDDRIEMVFWKDGNPDYTIEFFYTEHGTDIRLYICHLGNCIFKRLIRIDKYQDPQYEATQHAEPFGCDRCKHVRNETEVKEITSSITGHWFRTKEYTIGQA